MFGHFRLFDSPDDFDAQLDMIRQNAQQPTPCMCHGAGAEIIIFNFASTTSHTQTLAATLPRQMGYFLNAFLGQVNNLKKIEKQFKSARVVSLTNDMALIPMSGDLFNEINNYRGYNDIGKWQFLTTTQ